MAIARTVREIVNEEIRLDRYTLKIGAAEVVVSLANAAATADAVRREIARMIEEAKQQ